MTETLQGRCHCGNITYSFQTAKKPRELPLRICQCSFCNLQGAKYTCDREGLVSITINEASAAGWYQFGTKTAEFLFCRSCGVYACAVMSRSTTPVVVVSVHTLERAHEFTQNAVQMDFDTETIEQRVQRRRTHWTPASINILDVSPSR